MTDNDDKQQGMKTYECLCILDRTVKVWGFSHKNCLLVACKEII